MKKKEKTVLCLIFLAAILYSGVTYIANGAAILDYRMARKTAANQTAYK